MTNLEEDLNKALSLVGKAAQRRSTLPILANVLLAAEGDELRLSATNLEVAILCWIDARVKTAGRTTVPADLLAKFISSLPADTVDLDLNEKTQTLNLNCGRYKANMKGIEAEEFPHLPVGPVEEGEVTVKVALALLREMIKEVAFAAATDEVRPALSGVMVSFEDGNLTMTATDGFRMAKRVHPSGRSFLSFPVTGLFTRPPSLASCSTQTSRTWGGSSARPGPIATR